MDPDELRKKIDERLNVTTTPVYAAPVSEPVVTVYAVSTGDSVHIPWVDPSTATFQPPQVDAMRVLLERIEEMAVEIAGLRARIKELGG